MVFGQFYRICIDHPYPFVQVFKLAFRFELRPWCIFRVCLLGPAAYLIKGPVGVGAAVEDADGAVLKGAVLRAGAGVARRSG